MDKKVLLTRTLTGIVFGVIMVEGMIWNQYSFIALTTIICAGCLWEYYGMISSTLSYKTERKLFFRISATIVGLIAFSFFVVPVFNILLIGYLVVALPLLFVLFAFELFSGERRSFQNAGLNLLGIFYISIPIGLLHIIVFLQSNTHSSWFPGNINAVFGLLLLIWTNDTFAYLIGSLIGSHKMFPSVSPKKSWEGFFGGLIFSLIVGWLLSMWLTTLPLKDWLVFAVIATVVGTAGDLFESMIKRNLGLKDSGKIMPGHGGFLDRFDAFIFCIPFVFAYLFLK